VPLLAERVLSWAELSKASICELAPQDFQSAVERIRARFLLLPFNPAWASAEERAIIPLLDKKGMMRFPTAADLAAVPLPADEIERFIAKELGAITDERVKAAWPALKAQLDEWYTPPDFSTPAPPARAIEFANKKTDKRLQMLDQGKSFIQDGVRYFPLSAAAPIVQASPQTILRWIKNGTEFDGQPVQSFHFAPTNQYFISEGSIEKAANRFLKWPSREPAGAVTLGEKKDQSGYVRLTKAAITLGVDHHTIWRWVSLGTTPTEKPLDVIVCPAAAQYYIRQKEITALKKHVPRSGLRAGRRPQHVPA
jgi:hypothetical protein